MFENVADFAPYLVEPLVASGVLDGHGHVVVHADGTGTTSELDEHDAEADLLNPPLRGSGNRTDERHHRMNHHPLRGRAAWATLALALGLALAACGSDDSSGDDSSPASADGFPVTVAGTHGDVTVEAEPERVVALDVQTADILVALGVQPVAVAISADELATTYPHLEGRFTGELDAGLLENYEAKAEKIAEYEPDLIVGSAYSVSDEAYAQVEAVAPTLPGVEEGNVHWVVTTEAIAQLVGADAQKVIDDVEQVCADARATVPGLEGKTYNWVAAEEGTFRFGNGSALECLGLTADDGQDDTQKTSAGISTERLDELDGDVLAVWDYLGEQAKSESDPRWAQLPAVQANAVVKADMVMASVLNSPGPSSFDYLVETVLPVLQKSSYGK